MTRSTILPAACTLAFIFLTGPLRGQNIPLSNPGFEDHLTGWNVIKVDRGKSELSEKAAHSGKLGLEVTDEDTAEGSEVFSELLPAESGKNYEVRFWARNLQGTGMGVYLLFYGSDRRHLTEAKVTSLTLPADGTEWKEYTFEQMAPDGTELVAIRLHSYGAALVKAQFDDFSLKASN